MDRLRGENRETEAEDTTVDPIDTLVNEHGLIRQYLDALRLASEHLDAGHRPSRAFFDKAVDFARTFTDSFHHFKEEEVLFVRLAEKRSGEIDARLQALRDEHERGRELVAAIDDALAPYEAGDPAAVAGLLDTMAAFVELLRHHLWVEDQVVLPLARRTLTRTELNEIEIEFLKAKAKHWDNAFERYRRVVIEMGGLLTELEQ